MVAKKSGTQTRGKVKVGKLKLNKETVKDLTASEAKRIKGGAGQATPPSPAPSVSPCTDTCNCTGVIKRK